MLPRLSNSSAAGAEEASRCIVNDQMGAFTVLYILIFIVSLPGNLLSLWAFIRCSWAKQSVGVYLINLLAADLLLLLALPFKILKDVGAAPWSLMVFHCQASAVTIYISLYASLVFLAFIITDCYLQECQTTRHLPLLEFGFARLLSVVVWLLLLLLMVPNMTLPTRQVQVQQYLSCSSLKKDISLHWHALTIFLCMVLFLNASAVVLVSSTLALKRFLRSRCDPKVWAEKRGAARTLVAMTLAFILCFVPYHSVRAPYTLAQAQLISDCPTKRQLFLGKESTLLLTVLHLCFDPVLFFRLHAPYREALSRVLRCVRKRPGGAPEEQAEEMLEPTSAPRQEEERDPDV